MASSNLHEQTKNLSNGGNEAIQALLSSITSTDGNEEPSVKHQIASKLSQLVGEEAAKYFLENGGNDQQPFNEDGLPIIEITEQIPDESPSESPLQAKALIFEPDLLPLYSLPQPELNRQLQLRNQILDLLEAEERREEEREKLAASEQRRLAKEHRPEAEKMELAKLKAMKEIQKKMGKALVQTAHKAKPDELKLYIGEENQKELEAIPKKSVSFAGDVSVNEELDLGDVTLGRLRLSSRPSRPMISDPSLPMRLNVVERMPNGQQKLLDIPDGDSDDESEPPSSSSESENSDSEPGYHPDDDLAEDDEHDLELAAHQREVAREYYKKRDTIGEDALRAMKSHSHDTEEEIDRDLQRPRTKASISQFRARQLTESYGTTSTSLPSIIPASGAKTVQSAIRMGKLDSEGRLAGGPEGESGSDDDTEAAAREILELLQKGELYNVGPDSQNVHLVPPPQEAVTNLPSLPQKPKSSRFKISRSQAGLRSHVTEKPTFEDPTTKPVAPVVVESPSYHPPPTSPSMIVESPSFPSMGRKSATSVKSDVAETSSLLAKLAIQGSTPVISNVVESLSYPKKLTTQGKVPVIESTPSRSTMIESPTSPQSTRPSMPPIVMSTTVKESIRKANVNVEEPLSSKKISRFMYERM